MSRHVTLLGEVNVTPILDTQRLRELSELGGEEFLVELFDIYLNESAEVLAALRSVSDAPAPPAVERLAHKLKGMSSQIGGVALAKVCREMMWAASGRIDEQTKGPPMLDDMQRLMPQLLEEADRLDAELRARVTTPV